MSKEYAIRGTGFIGGGLRRHLDHHIDLPRDWVELPAADVLVNFAAYGNYHDQNDIREIYRVNVLEVLRLLEASRYPVILISSSSVTLPSQTFYSLSKKAMEEAALLYSKTHGTPVAIIRPSSVTGIGEQERHLIPSLIRSCLYGEEIPFVGDPVHDFIDIDDFVAGLIWVADHLVPGYQGRIVNLSSGRGYSNEQIKDLVESVTGKKANLRRVDSLRSYDTKDWVVEDSLPELVKKPIYQSIKEMIEHEKQNV